MRALALLLAAFALALPAAGATFTVNNTSDVVDARPGDGICETLSGNGVCTLRAAIQEAGALSGPQSIVIPAGTYLLTATPACTYSLVTNNSILTENMSALCVKGNVTITGAGATNTIIDANGQNSPTCCGSYPSARGMFVDLHATVHFSGVTIQHGLGNGGFDVVGGGAINNQGHLTISACNFITNNGVPGGGGVWNDGTLDVSDSIFDGNQAASYGGPGIYNSGSGPATITNSTFSSGNSSTNGGAIFALGTVTISNSAIYNNTATANGGAIYADSGNLTLTNLTISTNQAHSGGAIYSGNSSHVSANNLTMVNNKALGTAAAILASNAVRIGNSIIFGNTDGLHNADCNFNLASNGYNIIDTFDSNCTLAATDLGHVDPNLGSLTYNGGPTQTHALLPGSPAIDAGNPAAPGSGGTSCPAIDQRGYLRPIGARCDIGAYEQNTNFLLTSVFPVHASNSGPAELTLGGSGFDSNVTVKLSRGGQADIPGSQVSVAGGSAALTAVFDLTSQSAGAWDVVVTNSSNVAVTLPAAFTVDPPGAPLVHIQVIGPSAVRADGYATFFLTYQNLGNVDAYAVPVDLDVPTYIPLSLAFPVASPPVQTGQAISDWTGAPLYATPDPSQGVVNVPLLLPVVPAGSNTVIRFQVFIPASLEGKGATIAFYASNGSPLMAPTLDATLLSQLTANAISYAQTNLGATVPSSQTGAISAYIANQYQLAVSAGRAAYAGSLGAQPLIFSAAQLTIDAAAYAAAQALTSSPASIRSSRLTAHDTANPGAPKNPCSGGVMTPGASCNGNPDPFPPDPGGPPKPFSPADCRAIGKHSVSSDGTMCVPDKRDCALLQNPHYSDPNCLFIPIKAAVDPNDKWGPLGASTQLYLTTIARMNYMVEFQNLPTAALPAQTVVVTDQLDTSSLDVSSFSFGPILFGNYQLTPPPGSQQFTGALDLRPDTDVAVRVDASLNKVNGLITWRFTTLDPVTLQPTSDPTAGFLPPDVTPPQGEGRLLYSVLPRSTVTTGSTICNQATVVFDGNAPISTAQWCNTFDTVAPVSHASTFPAFTTNTSFPVQWSGSDATSGILNYSIYVSDNGGPYTAWLPYTNLTQSTYNGVLGHTYNFYSIAIDNAHNSEPDKAAADTTMRVVQSGTLAPCDTNGDNAVTAVDIQATINEALGNVVGKRDLNHDGAVNVVDLQIQMNAALSLGCSVQ